MMSGFLMLQGNFKTSNLVIGAGTNIPTDDCHTTGYFLSI